MAYFNFETNPSLASAFDESLEPSYLVPLLSRLAGRSIVTEKTLVIFDEVQLCERALTSLKYFCELAPAHHVIACGSLLGVAVNRKKFSSSVGTVDMKSLYPMELGEFLLACGGEELAGRTRDCFGRSAPLPDALHATALKDYRQSLLICALLSPNLSAISCRVAPSFRIAGISSSNT